MHMVASAEKCEAIVAGAILAILASVCSGTIDSTAFNNLMTTGATFSSIAIGFLASVLSVIVAISTNPTIQAIFKVDNDDRSIITYLVSVMRWALCLLIASGIGFVYFTALWLIIWCFLAGATVGAFERAIRIMAAVVKRSVYS